MEGTEELVDSITDCIRFYNEDHLQAKINGLSPMEFRAKADA
ncbi:IS3 family transposase [Virgibacillus sp. W0181]